MRYKPTISDHIKVYILRVLVWFSRKVLTGKWVGNPWSPRYCAFCGRHLENHIVVCTVTTKKYCDLCGRLKSIHLGIYH